MIINFNNFLNISTRIQYTINKFIFYTIFSLLFLKVNSFDIFRAYNLLSEEILLITDEGIFNLNPETEEQTFIYKFQDNITYDYSEIPYISFAQFSYDDENYTFCRIKQYLFFISLGNSYIITENEMTNSSASLIPYQKKDKSKILFVGFINSKKYYKLKNIK